MSTRARIATVCQAGRCRSTVEENRAEMLRLLGLALACRPDLVCLPEAFPSSGVPSRSAADTAEDLHGPTIDAMAQRARQHRCYVIVPLHTRRGGRIYNSAVVLGRDGSIVGVYDKVQPVTTSPDYTELEQGITPGAEYPVFDLDFGRIGIQICFDVQFPAGWARIAEQGARVIFWPSAYNGGYPLHVYAAQHQLYVVSSVRSDKARIVDPCGTALAMTDTINNTVWRDINLDYMLCHDDFNWPIPERIHAAYSDSVEIRSHMDAGRFLVEPIDPTVTTAQLAEEFGFEDMRHYSARHEPAYVQARQGRPASPQCAGHGTRPQWAKE